jgi:signal transduction histidine kinase
MRWRQPQYAVWERFLPRQRIGIRLVVAITLAMAMVLVAAGALVFVRVAYALNHQLDQDLAALAEIAERDVTSGSQLPTDTPGQTVQVYDLQGNLLQRSNERLPRLASRAVIRGAGAGLDEDVNRGGVLSPTPFAYRISAFKDRTKDGREVIVVAAINRHSHDEALRELLVQLLTADFLAIVAAGFVAFGAARAALGPVERYRRAAVSGGSDGRGRLPVDEDRDDELTRLGHTFNNLLDEIEEGHERERGFLADASHELRSPLAVLAAEIEWARHRTRTKEQLDEVFDSLGGQISRLVDLSNALLDLEELRSGTEERLAAVTTDELASGAIAGHVATAAGQSRNLAVHADGETVEVDPRWLELALSNLVGNALKYGVGTVTLDLRVEDDRLRVAVRDEGDGVPASLGERAFDRFTRADESRTSRGNGLGLALVRAVAEEHGGGAHLVHGGVVIDVPARAARGASSPSAT